MIDCVCICVSHSITLGAKEFYISKLMVTYGYDRDNAEKVFEIIKYQYGHSIFCKSSLIHYDHQANDTAATVEEISNLFMRWDESRMDSLTRFPPI